MSTPTETPNLWRILAESKRIINSSRHFLALYVIFLLPLSCCLIIYPTFQSTHSHTQSNLVNILLYNLFVSIFSLLPVGTITYSTYNVYYGRHVNLLQSIKSLGHSFIPLLSTLLAAQILGVFIFLVLFLLVLLVTQTLGSEIDNQSTGFVGFVVALSVVLVLLVLYLQVNWVLASVVVVVESKWGFEPLWRSANLVKGVRMVSFWLILLYIVLSGLFIWEYSMWAATAVRVSGWKSLRLVLQVVAGSSLVAMVMLHYMAANTVLFIYCKASHGELASKEEEFGRDYVSLPFDDDNKLPRGVPVV